MYYARNRLLRWMRDFPRPMETGTLNTAHPSRPTGDIPSEERLEELVQVKTGSSMLDRYAEVARDVRAITDGRVRGVYTVVKGI